MLSERTREFGGSRNRVGPMALWRLSAHLHRRGLRRIPKLIKFVNYMLFRCILPPEVAFRGDLDLPHRGLGIVIHPNTTIDWNVRIWHGVTIASDAQIGTKDEVIIESAVEIGTGAVIVNRVGKTLVIGHGATIGANCTVTKSVPPGATVVSQPARLLKNS